MKIKFKKLSPKTKQPTKAHSTDAAWDTYAIESLEINPGEAKVVSTGLACDIPEGWHIQVHTRSSQGKNMLKAHLGIIDSGYLGEISILIHNFGNKVYKVNEGDRVAQLLFLPVPEVEFEEVEELQETSRGTKGFGSSGK